MIKMLVSAVLNAGLLAIVWLKGWRSLALMGFIFTFVVGTAWPWIGRAMLSSLDKRG